MIKYYFTAPSSKTVVSRTTGVTAVSGPVTTNGDGHIPSGETISGTSCGGPRLPPAVHEVRDWWRAQLAHRHHMHCH